MRYLLIISILLFPVSLFCQEENIDRLKPGALKNFARNAERMHDTYTAIKYYSAYIEKKPKDFVVMRHLAELEEASRNYSNACVYYGLVFESNNTVHLNSLYDKARMLKMQGEYSKAKEEFNRFLTLGKKTLEKDIKKLATSEMNGCDTAAAFVKNPVNVVVKNMGTEINKPHIEFSPFPVSEDEIIFGSLPEEGLKYYELTEEKPRRKLYKAEKKGDKWVRAGEMTDDVNSPTMHTANGVYSEDQNRFYFTHCNEDWQNTVKCQIWMMEKTRSGSWSDPVKLNENINLDGFTSTQPALGIDSKGKEVLYFVSDRPEGVGGLDLWSATYDLKKRTWSSPKNMGKAINTPKNEVTPYYSHKERKLYFSTDGRAGLGGLDIYSSRGEAKKWGPASNVGYPINSSVDDLYFVLNPDGEGGFIVSNRKGGSQFLHATCCDDIYEFRKVDPVHIAIAGRILNSEDADYINGKSDQLDNKASQNPSIDKAKIGLYIIDNGVEIWMTNLESDTQGNFEFDLEPEMQYRIVVEKDGYLNNDIHFDTYNIKKSETLTRNVGLSKVTEGSIIIENIEYNFNSPDLTDEAKKRIDRTLLNVLNENPGIKIEIGSHTDNKGTDSYNMKLSQQRAESVVAYLKEKGVSPKRLIAKGYGETKPIAMNENPDGSDNEAGRQRNRRTEFRIVGKVDLPRIIEDEE